MRLVERLEQNYEIIYGPSPEKPNKPQLEATPLLDLEDMTIVMFAKSNSVNNRNDSQTVAHIHFIKIDEIDSTSIQGTTTHLTSSTVIFVPD